MSVTNYFRPFEEIRRLENEVSDIFRSFRQHGVNANTLPVNIMEDSENYRLMVAIPGFDKEDVDIQATSSYIEITAERDIKDLLEDQKWDTLVQEIPTGTFRRRINFEKPIDTNQAHTTIKDGMLWITLPKTVEARTVKLEPKLLEA